MFENKSSGHEILVKLKVGIQKFLENLKGKILTLFLIGEHQ